MRSILPSCVDSHLWKGNSGEHIFFFMFLFHHLYSRLQVEVQHFTGDNHMLFLSKNILKQLDAISILCISLNASV